jgi:hypothetical protein
VLADSLLHLGYLFPQALLTQLLLVLAVVAE